MRISPPPLTPNERLLPREPAPPWIHEAPHGVHIDVLVQPRASRSKVAGIHDARVKILLAAPPVDGAANEALLDLLATMLLKGRRDLQIVRGATSRRKTIAVAGVSVREARNVFAGDES